MKILLGDWPIDPSLCNTIASLVCRNKRSSLKSNAFSFERGLLIGRPNWSAGSTIFSFSKFGEISGELRFVYSSKVTTLRGVVLRGRLIGVVFTCNLCNLRSYAFRFEEEAIISGELKSAGCPLLSLIVLVASCEIFRIKLGVLPLVRVV